jgi:hypothetical protein
VFFPEHQKVVDASWPRGKGIGRKKAEGLHQYGRRRWVVADSCPEQGERCQGEVGALGIKDGGGEGLKCGLQLGLDAK